MSQATDVKKLLIELMDSGVADKKTLYAAVVEKLNVPRPTVRRIVRDLRNDLMHKVEILQDTRHKTELI